MCAVDMSPDVPKAQRFQADVIIRPRVARHQAIAQAAPRAVAATHPPLLPHLHRIIAAVPPHRQAVTAASAAAAAHPPVAVMAAVAAQAVVAVAVADVTD